MVYYTQAGSLYLLIQEKWLLVSGSKGLGLGSGHNPLLQGFGYLLWKSATKASEKVERSLYMLCKFFLLEEISEVEAEKVGKKFPSLCGQESLGS